ncbi:acyltransferase family protein [Azospirillum rugosum]|uniref:Peptidoglycan/LPS O-acetylase OafA/YrhL n=1 Tax=Azospirillum rugosum TaxID=416170 RepID=A0ABS4SGU2_9PROT|nr:acyltransferase [Azospirillum rugosum]MBP2291665.1 peptidoglycan/LPS O-acetylase OafA/YrhL [Azospirillum rugosum]MDQ0524523.1 peptidoglycan/LPS O-acetylase OafA/YrhL [Azospirillum rugosum]
MSQKIHDNNFDAMRLLAATLVVYSHAFALHGLSQPRFLGFAFLGELGVYIFFIMSGYLVVQSWMNDPHPLRFLVRRSLRIFPALIAVVFLSACALGPLLTTLPAGDYFSHPITLRYLANAYLVISYALPGVFDTNPYPVAVNGSLWSLPIEFLMYVFVLAFGVVGLVRMKWTLPLTGAMLIAVGHYFREHQVDAIVFAGTDFRQAFFVGVYFFAGASLYMFRDAIRFSISGVAIACAFGLALNGSPWIQYWSVIGLPYIVIAVCVQSESWLQIPKKVGDLSYGIYLYSFPVQQTLESFLHDKLGFLSIFALELVITAFLAFCSWHGLEKLALRLKPKRSEGRRLIPASDASRITP